MAIERTFSIVKPDAVAHNKIGTVVGLLEEGGLRIVAQKMLRMTETYRYPGSERFIDALLWRRNKIMAERMQVHLRRGAAFVAVGALHLPGKGGILDLLTRDGYSVTAID
jgi:uncharacterized protein YbaP (TraB family)